jgi:hypothetical protein
MLLLLVQMVDLVVEEEIAEALVGKVMCHLLPQAKVITAEVQARLGWVLVVEVEQK